MSLQIRRGTAAQLAAITPVVGELVYTTDTKVVYVGDGTTVGGVPVAVGGAGNITGTNILTSGVVSATGNITGGNVTTLGNVSGNYILGNGSQLTGLPATYGNANVAVYLPTYSGNISGGNVSATGNITGGNVVTVGQITAVGNISGAYILGNGALLTGVATGAANAATLVGTTLSSNVTVSSLTSVGTLSTLSVTANATVGNILTAGLISAAGNISAGNITATNHTGLATSMVGNITGGNIATAGIISAAGNVTTGANLLAVGNVQALGNISGTYFIGNGALLTGITSGSNYSNSNVSGFLPFYTGNVGAGNVIVTGIISAQGNITGSALSVGTGNITAGNTTGGNITAALISATGNINGNYLKAALDINAGGNVSAVFHTGSGVSVTGNITGGNITTVGNVSGNYLLGNGALLTGLPATYGNTTVASFLAALGSNSISTTGNISASNINVGNTLIITANSILGASTLTLGQSGNNGNIIIAGNLQVLGTTTTINSTTITTNDLVIYLANNASSSSAATGAGIGVGPSGVYGTFTYNSTLNAWTTGLAISATGNITGGNITTAALTATGSLVVNAIGGATAIVNGGANGSGNIGASGATFNTVFAKATTAQYADLAEMYISDSDYIPGTVVVFGGDQQITTTADFGDERVAGVISTQPAHLMNAGQPGLPVALRGQVPVRVIGAVVKGDSLVTSNTPGVAQSVGRDRSFAQAIFAKSLETDASVGERTILAVIL